MQGEGQASHQHSMWPSWGWGWEDEQMRPLMADHWEMKTRRRSHESILEDRAWIDPTLNFPRIQISPG